MPHYILDNRPGQQVLEAGSAMCRHDNQIAVPLLRHLADRGSGVTVQDHHFGPIVERLRELPDDPL